MVEIGGKAPMMLSVMWTLQCIAFILVGLRLYARLNVVHTYGWDDHFFNGSVVLLLVYNVLLTVASSHGLGQPVPKPPTDTQSHALLLTNVAQVVINASAILVKVSIASFLLRLVPSARSQRAVVVLPVAVMSALVVAITIAMWFTCDPVESSWDLKVKVAKCDVVAQFGLTLSVSLCMILTEVFYASFPWYLIWRLQMPKRERITIGLCMSLGYLSVICSVFRLLDVLYLSRQGVVYDVDPLVSVVEVLIWHEADVTTQLLCIGLSVCRPLYKDWLNNVVVKIGSINKSGNKSKSYGPDSGFSVIALQTIGGSSFINKSGRKDSVLKNVDGGVVKVERSWRVESDSFILDDGASEEHMLGGAGRAKAKPDDQRHA